MKPTYSLSKIKNLIRKGQYRITNRAISDALEDFDLLPSDILKEVMQLTADDFDKTMPSSKRPDTYQDVYFRTVTVSKHKKIAYIKINIIRTRKEEAIVISFHKSTGPKGKPHGKG